MSLRIPRKFRNLIYDDFMSGTVGSGMIGAMGWESSSSIASPASTYASIPATAIAGHPGLIKIEMATPLVGDGYSDAWLKCQMKAKLQDIKRISWVMKCSLASFDDDHNASCGLAGNASSVQFSSTFTTAAGHLDEWHVYLGGDPIPTGVKMVADEFFLFEIEIDPDKGAWFYINGQGVYFVDKSALNWTDDFGMQYYCYLNGTGASTYSFTMDEFTVDTFDYHDQSLRQAEIESSVTKTIKDTTRTDKH